MKPTLKPDIAHAAYHADDFEVAPTLSSSIAHKLLSRSPLHAFHAHPKLGAAAREDATAAMDHGALMHCLLLGKGPSLVRVDARDWRTKAAQEARDAARSAGHVAVLADQLARAVSRAHTVKEILVARWGIKLDGLSEVTALWQEGETWCRGRFDHWIASDATVYDLKFTESAAPDAFARSVFNLGADIQAAAYVSAVETIHPELAGRVKYKWIAIEEDPDLVQVYSMAGSMRELGQRRWQRAVEIWAGCLASKKWPGYGEVELPIEPPPWAMAADMKGALNGIAGGSQNVGF